MQLVEQHIVDKNDSRWEVIDEACFASKNLYNAANYIIRDFETIGKQETYMGQRIERGLFRSKSGRLINADQNGACNILRKVAPNAFADGVEGVVVRPLKVSFL